MTSSTAIWLGVSRSKLCRRIRCVKPLLIGDRSETVQWLQKFKDDDSAMTTFRMIVSEEAASLPLYRMTNDLVIEQFATILQNGTWHVHAPRFSAPARRAIFETQETEETVVTPNIAGQAVSVHHWSVIKTWIEFKLIDEKGEPVPNAAYRVVLPDGVIKTGTLDADGWIRFNNLDPGQCTISFPDIDAREWYAI